MMQENNVRINVPPLSFAKNEITIAGEKEGVQRCKDAILKCHKEMVSCCRREIVSDGFCLDLNLFMLRKGEN